jgi:hypothetical protein
MTTAGLRRCWERVRVRRSTVGGMAGAARPDVPEAPHDGHRPLLTQEEYRAVRFAIDLVDRLGAEHGFDPAELVSPITGQPFGAFIERMRSAMLRVEAAAQSNGCLDGRAGRDVPERGTTGWVMGGRSLD